MTKPTPKSPLDLVTALMQERVKFETWLEALDARRASTPANVYDRVRQDYETRLAGVIHELKEHAAALEEQAEKYTTRLAELTQQEQERRDARAEAELRAHVGELSEQDWNTTASEADEALAAIAAEQSVVGADLNRVHELLGAATAPPAVRPAPPDGALPEPAATAEAGGQVVAGRDSGSSASAPAGAAMDRGTPEHSKFDELAFLKSVVSPLPARTPVDNRAGGGAVDAPPPADGHPSAKAPEPDVAPSAARPSGSHEDRPDARPSGPNEGHPAAARASSPDITRAASDTLGEALSERARRPTEERDFVREDQEDAAAGLVGRAREPERPNDRPYAANITANNPIVLRPSGAVEQPKTLKCAECGAMNYPTEWYCERCGAELASL